MNCDPTSHDKRSVVCKNCGTSFPGFKPGDSVPKRNCANGVPVVLNDGLKCRNIGERMQDQDCPSCQGTVRIKTFACAIHGRCTLAKKLPDIACCQGCKEYQHPRDSADDGRGG